MASSCKKSVTPPRIGASGRSRSSSGSASGSGARPTSTRLDPSSTGKRMLSMPAILPMLDDPWITRVGRVVPWEQRVAELEAAGHAARVAGRRREAAIAFNDAGLAATDGGLLDRAIPLFTMAAADLAG